jgi:hypothetical protein
MAYPEVAVLAVMNVQFGSRARGAAGRTAPRRVLRIA